MNNVFPKLNSMPAAPLPIWKEFNKQQFKDLIDECNGIISLIVVKTGRNYRLIYNALDKFELRDYFNEAKNMFVAKAELALFSCLESENESIKLKAALTVLDSNIAKKDGWGKEPQVQVNQIIADEEKLKLIKSIFSIN